MEPSAGEFIYDTIFVAPVSNVVDRLNKYASRQELWIDLPKALIDKGNCRPLPGGGRFESHSHESEQITMVLEGVLYFEQGAKVIGVRAGEAIAIPAHAPHAVFTGEDAVKAVDAWSPVMAKYKQGDK